MRIKVSAAVAGVVAVLSTAVVGSSAFAQDAENGADVFKKCRACHQVGENAKNAVGPELNGVIGRKAGSVAGFNYSDANKSSGVVWDEATFANYIKDPRAAMPGTKMAFAGIKDPEDVKDLLAFLKQYDANGKKM
ncbi:MAG: cytochrome c family protein [Hyphomicrobiaceae bacterium]|jgi:cytochrome c